MYEVTIYTDGACSGNPGVGGWGAVLICKGHERQISGCDPHTTNNKMELMAAIMALERLNAPCNVLLYSDSAYLINAFAQGWIDNWKMSGWKTKGGKPVQNKGLWERLLSSMKNHNVKFIKVKGHSDNIYNNLCDEMAREEIKKQKERNKS